MNDWENLSEDDLLKIRIRDLKLDPKTSDIYPWVTEVFEELRTCGLVFQPRIYLGDEWFSPEGLNAVAIPFFLSHPRLRELEKKFMLDCEGYDEMQFKELFRHELGHAFDHAFKVSKRKSWANLFGSPKKEYKPETYRPRPYSRNFVHNIGGFYAQAHPDEDFAETFAVWLNPKSNWKTAYKRWGAYKKLVYVERMAEEFREKQAWPPIGRMMSDARFLKSTLKNYYDKKRRTFAEDSPDFYDRDLLKIFSKKAEGKSAANSASKFLKRNRRTIVQTMSQWTGERKATVSEILERITKRSKELELSLPENESKVLLDLSAFLATLVSHYLFTGHFRRMRANGKMFR